MVNMPKVVGYHRVLWVRKPDGDVVQVMVRMDDFYPDEEVLAKLKEVYPGGTVGELVESIKKNGELPKVGNGVMSACIKNGGPECEDPLLIRSWGAILTEF